MMFNPYAESLSSTGEPPTISSDPSRGAGDTSQISLSSSSSRSLLVQEPDSGYEASPSSIGDQRFFGEQSMTVANVSDMYQSPTSNSDDEFDIVECHSQILFSDSESDELEDYDTCLECSSSLCNCVRTDSSNTNATACDTRCSSELSYNRPSSQPIQIPILPSCRIRSNGHPRIEIFGPIIVNMNQLSRSQPCPLQRLGLVSDNRPLSWPPSASRNRIIALPSPRNNFLTQNPNSSRRYTHPIRRRQIIDSDASSFCSSDDDGPEDVFRKLIN